MISQSLAASSSMEVPRTAAVRPRFLQGISRIKPEMMQKVLSSIVQSEEKKTNNASCELFSGLKLMELFPERKSDEQQPTGKSSPRSCESRIMDPQENPNMSELTIFYNGAVNVYAVPHDKAQEIMKLANSTLSKDQTVSSNSDLKAAEKTPANSNAAGPASGNEQSHKLPGGLAQVRKQSLQRFLQKRKDRLNSVAPFPLTKSEIQSSKHAASEDEDLKLSLVLPSHRAW